MLVQSPTGTISTALNISFSAIWVHCVNTISPRIITILLYSEIVAYCEHVTRILMFPTLLHWHSRRSRQSIVRHTGRFSANFIDCSFRFVYNLRLSSNSVGLFAQAGSVETLLDISITNYPASSLAKKRPLHQHRLRMHNDVYSWAMRTLAGSGVPGHVFAILLALSIVQLFNYVISAKSVKSGGEMIMNCSKE